jgi:hypothetical protein
MKHIVEGEMNGLLDALARLRRQLSESRRLA